MYRQLERFAGVLARAIALAGGAALLAVVALNCVSIAGRALVPLQIGVGPIRGIYDITEIGMAAAVFAFLPWAQFNGAHVRVNLLRRAMPGGVERALEVAFDAAALAVATVIAWRLWLGMLDKLAYGETTPIAQIPIWTGYAAGLAGAVGFAAVSLFGVLRSARRLAGTGD